MLLPMNVLLKNPYDSIFHFNQILNFMFLGLKMHGGATCWPISSLPIELSNNFVLLLI